MVEVEVAVRLVVPLVLALRRSICSTSWQERAYCNWDSESEVRQDLTSDCLLYLLQPSGVRITDRIGGI